ncbi:MAG: MATE family efflux transporter [Lachnospiraceae bacterium]|nr:MATE family efflux transporter [Lachnospiraceae bacterium]MCI9202508.1 MATE family efflux transporter [Lachnospiraceae bacterium]
MDKKYDLTEGNVLKTIVYFMLPILAGNVFQQLYSTVDTIIVGRTLGADALAAVGGTGSIQFMVFGFSSGLASGVTVLTSQYIGAKDREKASRSVAMIYMVDIGITIICTVGGILLLPVLLNILHMPSELYGRAYTYQFICFAGLAGKLLYNLEASLLRAIGDSRTPLIFLILASMMNIILDLIFIIDLHMDVSGAALATIFSESFSGAACLLYSLKKYEMLRVRKKDFRIECCFLKDHIKTGVPISIQNSITGIGVMVFQSALNGMGTNSIAAYTACHKIETFATMPMFAIGTALVTYVAQNFGAKKNQRIKQGVNAALFSCLVFSIAIGAGIIIFCRPLVSVFVGNKALEVIRLSQIYVAVEGSCLWCAALLFVYRAAVQGVGVTKIPMWGGFLELFMRIFAAVYLSRLLGFRGLAAAYPLAWLAAAVLNITYYAFLCRNGFERNTSHHVTKGEL